VCLKKCETFISNLYSAHFLNLMAKILMHFFIVINSELLLEYIGKDAMFGMSYVESNDRQKCAKKKCTKMCFRTNPRCCVRTCFSI
jgi:hypothetical protein